MPTRCPNGSQRNIKTGNCEKHASKSTKRCPNGLRKNKQTKKCEHKKLKNSPKKKVLQKMNVSQKPRKIYEPQPVRRFQTYCDENHHIYFNSFSVKIGPTICVFEIRNGQFMEDDKSMETYQEKYPEAFPLLLEKNKKYKLALDYDKNEKGVLLESKTPTQQLEEIFDYLLTYPTFFRRV